MNRSLRILVVDDNETALKLMQKLLTLRGHTVEAAPDGATALLSVPAFAPQAIMLDIGLPDMSGHDVARALREEQRYEGTLIALTGYGQESDKEEARTAGFDHHLVKPAGLAEIEAILDTIED